MVSETAEDSSSLASNPTIISSIFTYISIFLLIFLIFLVSVQVLIRIIGIQFNSFWIAPLSQLLLIVGTYIGSVVATRNNQHIKLDLFQKKASQVNRTVGKVVEIIAQLAVLATLLIMLVATAQATASAWDTEFGSINIIKSGYIYFAIFIGIMSMISYESVKLFTEVKSG